MSVLEHGAIGVICKKCHQRKRQYEQKWREDKTQTKFDHIMANGHSCERCKRLFIKAPDGSTRMITLDIIDKTITFDGNTWNVDEFITQNRDRLEIRHLEWDHLPREEFEQRYPGVPFVGKNPNGFQGSLGLHREIQKCQLLCSLCHLRVTISREKATPRTGIAAEKYALIHERKKAIGKCVLCDCWHADCLRYFHFDHIDVMSKRDAISGMAVDCSVTPGEMLLEMDKCRLLCYACHRIHTNMQYQDGTMTKKRTKNKKLKHTK